MARVVPEILTIEDVRQRLDEMRAEIQADYGDVELFKERGRRYDLEAAGLAKYENPIWHHVEDERIRKNVRLPV